MLDPRIRETVDAGAQILREVKIASITDGNETYISVRIGSASVAVPKIARDAHGRQRIGPSGAGLRICTFRRVPRTPVRSRADLPDASTYGVQPDPSTYYARPGRPRKLVRPSWSPSGILRINSSGGVVRWDRSRGASTYPSTGARPADTSRRRGSGTTRIDALAWRLPAG